MPRGREGRPASASPGTSLPTDSRQVRPLSFLLLIRTSFQNFVPLCLPGTGEGVCASGSAAAVSGRASVDRSGAGGKGDRGVDERALESSFVCCMHGLCGVPSTRGRPCKDGLKQRAVLRFGKKLLRLHSLCLIAVACRWLYAKAFFCTEGSGCHKRLTI